MRSIQEYAKLAGVSPRAIRLRIHEGSLPARKVAGAWMIPDDAGRPHARRPGRKLSARSFDLLADYLDGDSAAMSSDGRRRAAERAARIQKFGVEQVREFARRPDLVVSRFRAGREDLAELRGDPRLHFTGVSHQGAEVYGPVIDAYLSRSDHDDLELFHLLEPALGSDVNVTLRVQDPPPRVRRLHVIADLLDDRDPRSDTEAERLLSELVGPRR